MKKSSKTTYRFPVIIERDELGYFIGKVPSLRSCYTQAKTLSDLKKRLKEAILLCLEMAQFDPQYRNRLRNFSYEPSFVGLELVEV